MACHRLLKMRNQRAARGGSVSQFRVQNQHANIVCISAPLLLSGYCSKPLRVVSDRPLCFKEYSLDLLRKSFAKELSQHTQSTLCGLGHAFRPTPCIACKHATKNPHMAGLVLTIIGLCFFWFIRCFIATGKPTITPIRWPITECQTRPIVWMLCHVITNNQVLVGFFLLA